MDGGQWWCYHFFLRPFKRESFFAQSHPHFLLTQEIVSDNKPCYYSLKVPPTDRNKAWFVRTICCRAGETQRLWNTGEHACNISSSLLSQLWGSFLGLNGKWVSNRGPSRLWAFSRCLGRELEMIYFQVHVTPMVKCRQICTYPRG